MGRASPRLPEAAVNLPVTSRLHNAGQLLSIVAVVGVLAYVAVAYFVDLAVWALPADADRRLGLEGLEPFDDMRVDDHPQRAQLQAMVNGLADGWPERPYDFEVAIIEQPGPNAFAAPGGGIIVTAGLLDGTQTGAGVGPPASEMELAFVLGHELGHFAGRDHLRGLGRNVLLSLLLGTAGVGGGDPGLAAGAAQLGSLRFNRAQELAADRFGLDLVKKRYGHVRGTFAFFERTLKTDGASGAVPNFTSTHPHSQVRIDALRDYARQRGWRTRTPRDSAHER